ncbi:hypothetical protein K1804_002932 [Listeria monocytogenes]|uniref:HNH endonuclease n=1 Tax=Listeria seeligeri TaxID=1640 RepID=UPI001624136A|nr:HNH endonuclease [Listeria seeligeri]EFM0818573.1 hypothetical protein [Listeria monocytogenes]EFM2966958.1 hypothetical protein [Listeria monocytogenes]EHX3821628.1 hypothetical protein [Listeria monocytogenes]EHX3879540.1 hypothetical protein [Listeria monocytogenes]MBC1597634.1 hypothetical protein [Listeria seeligeri]
MTKCKRTQIIDMKENLNHIVESHGVAVEDGEIFLRAKGLPSALVSSDGRVFSLKTYRILKSGYNRKGYERIATELCGIKLNVNVARLVAVTFGKDVPFRYHQRFFHAHHINGEKNDNRSVNLELITTKEHRAIHKALREVD